MTGVKTRDVIFNGLPLVLLRFPDGEGVLAFPDQIENGALKLECMFEPGFAHIDSDGQVWRHGHTDENVTTHPDLAAAWSELGDAR